MIVMQFATKINIVFGVIIARFNWYHVVNRTTSKLLSTKYFVFS